MLITFFPALQEYKLLNAHTMTGDAIIKQIATRFSVGKETVSILFEGFVIGKKETPADYHADDDKELFCFIATDDDIRENNSALQSSKKNSFMTSSSVPIARRVSTPQTIIRPPPPPIAKPLTDSEYAATEIGTGKYHEALLEVSNNEFLRHRFLHLLRDVDAKLFGIFSNNQNLFSEYINNATPTNGPTGNVRSAFQLLTPKDNEDIMRIMEIRGSDMDDAIRQYLDCNMNLDEWSQQYFE